MNEDETVDQYMNRVNEVVNSIRGLGEDLKGSVVCQKILRSLTSKYESKVSALEETKDLDEVTIDEIHGALTAFEMRIDPGTTGDKQVAFKAMKKLKISEKQNEEESEDEATAHFTRKLKKGTGKYENKLPFKCFNCGKVGHFAAKCPMKSKFDSDDEEDRKSKVKGKKNYNFKKNRSNRKSFISKRSTETSNDDSDEISEDEPSEALFMVYIEDQEKNTDKRKIVNSISSSDEERDNEDEFSSSDEEGEINFEEELVAAMKELKKERKHNKLASQEAKKQKQVIQELKAQYEESKKIIENLNTQLKQTSVDYSIVLNENASLKVQLEEQLPMVDRFEEFENEFTLLKTKVAEYEKEEVERQQKLSQHEELNNSTPVHPSSRKLDRIINSQRPFNVKFGLGFDKGETSNSVNSKKKSLISFVKESGKGKAPMVYVQEENHLPIPQTTNARQSKRVKQSNFNGRNYPSAPQRQMRYMAPSRPKSYFQGYCFKCNAYGHKIATCKFNMREVRFEGRNKFASLEENFIECYNCHNYGHIARECRIIFPFTPPQQKVTQQRENGQRKAKQSVNKKTPPIVRKVWKKKFIADSVEEESDGVACFKTMLKTQNKPSPWILDSGCSSHMTGDKKMFQQLQQYEGGTVKFGNNEGAKVTGKGSISINNGKVKLHDVFYVSGLKHNVLSISQICDRGHEVIFNKQGCEIKRIDNGKTVTLGQRTSKNLYTLTESVRDSCMTLLTKQ